MKSLAERTGKIKLGDIPVALNGKSLEGMPTSAIIASIREANAVRPLRMTFRRDVNESAQGKQAVIEQVFGPGPLGLELTANTNIAGKRSDRPAYCCTSIWLWSSVRATFPE